VGGENLNPKILATHPSLRVPHNGDFTFALNGDGKVGGLAVVEVAGGDGVAALEVDGVIPSGSDDFREDWQFCQLAGPDDVPTLGSTHECVLLRDMGRGLYRSVTYFTSVRDTDPITIQIL
jgi:hypothetical protein